MPPEQASEKKLLMFVIRCDLNQLSAGAAPLARPLVSARRELHTHRLIQLLKDKAPHSVSAPFQSNSVLALHFAHHSSIKSSSGTAQQRWGGHPDGLTEMDLFPPGLDAPAPLRGVKSRAIEEGGGDGGGILIEI